MSVRNECEKVIRFFTQHPSKICDPEYDYFRKFCQQLVISESHQCEESDDDEECPPMIEEMEETLEQKTSRILSIQTNDDETLRSLKEQISSQPTCKNIIALAQYFKDLNQSDNAMTLCDHALIVNQSYVKALKMRSQFHAENKRWEEALKDISLAQTVDFDEHSVEFHKSVMDNAKGIKQSNAKKEDETRTPTEKNEGKSDTSFNGPPSVPFDLNPEIMSGVQKLMSDPQAMSQIQTLASSFMKKHSA